MWEWSVPAADIADLRRTHRVSGALRRPDGSVRVRVVADTAPSPAATPAAPTLEDAYLARIGAAAGVAA